MLKAQRSTIIAAVMLAVVTVSATAQNPAPTPPAPTAPSPAAQDEEFITGLRRIGVMVGQVVECTPQGDRSALIEDAMSLADKIANNFGLKAAFNFTASIGYGSGKPFDKATCDQSKANWADLRKKYLEK